MASFDFDQAEGLRRMLQGPRPRVVTFLSATPEDDKGSMLINLGASLAQTGTDVLLVDACSAECGLTRRLGLDQRASLLQVARQQATLAQVIHAAPQGFSLVPLGASANADDAGRLANTFETLAGQTGTVIVDGELGPDGAFPVPLMAASEIVIQVSPSAASITNAYALIKRLSREVGKRPFGLLITNAGAVEARVVFDNMSAAASRYLGVRLIPMGAVPADEYLRRASQEGRAVVEAFPAAGASAAFRELAGKFALPAMPQASRHAARLSI